jgi:signal transduction histidine kinase/ActR/RegA family two-component response regulator
VQSGDLEQPVTIANAVAGPDGLGWRALARPARAYVAGVIATGTIAIVVLAPHRVPDPALFLFLLLTVCVTSAWKVNLPLSLVSGSTLSVSYAADLMALLLLGPRPAIVIAAAGVWTQCRINVKQRYPLYRTAFSVAAEVLTMAATGAVYRALGGSQGPFAVAALLKPLVGAIATYFGCNTGLVAVAIALSTGRRAWKVWREDFLWSGTSFVVAGTAGAMAAVVVERGEHWKALLLLAPIYLTYRTYRVFVGRLEDQRRHLEVMTRAEAERRALLEREQAAWASAEAANRLKDQFLATVSHELRTPMNAILGWADMLRSGALPAARRDRACEAIFTNATRQARLIDELLDMARIMAGKLQLERTEVDPREIAAGAVEIVQIAAEAKRIQIGVQVDPEAGAFHADGPRLQQVLWNLLSNAVKFTPEGGTIAVRITRRGRWGTITVTDSGIGIARDFLPAVFEPFRQADGSPTRVHDGLGLGLAIARQVVQAHGGTIAVDSPGTGQGSTFTVRIPAVRSSAPQRATTPGAGDTDPTSLDGLAILVVDDDRESREVARAHLENHHAIVLTAASAAEAMDVLQREHVDVLLADVAMPGEDGYSLVRKLRAARLDTAGIPAAALTAYAREEDRQVALRAGFQVHLTKPIDARSLVAAIAALRQAEPA